MKILQLSKYIKELQKLLTEHGDLPVIQEADASRGFVGYPNNDHGYYPWPAPEPHVVGITHGESHDEGYPAYDDRVVHVSCKHNSKAVSIS